MKKTLILSVAIMLVIGISGVAMAVDLGLATGVENSVHNLTTRLSETEICKVCHSPHDSSANRASDFPLWNHEVDITGYTMYNSPTTDEVPTAPGSHSKLCLGCHDGVTGIEAYDGVTIGTDLMTGNAKIPNLNGSDKDLSGTHPISMSYTYAGPNTDLNDPTGNLGISVVNTTIAAALVNGNVECSTCHDVHDQAFEAVSGTSLLRTTNDGSELCLSCHNK